MSGFFAVIKTDGSAPDRGLLTSLTSELRYRGPNGYDVWTDPHVGMGHALLHTTRTSEREVQPLVVESDRLALVADARIDDRVRLVEDLAGAGVSARSDDNDPELILAAYRAWGVGAPEHLLGDFSFVLWDAGKRRLLLARDGFGIRFLYIAACPGGWVVSNEIRPLLLYPGVSRAHDYQAMADFLVSGDVQMFDRTQTAFKAVRAVPFGGRVLIGLDGQRGDSIFWQPETHQPVLRYRRHADYEEHFRYVMREAVRDRIQGRKVLLLLSGGLDSTTVASFAAELTHAGEGADELTALTTVCGERDEEGRWASQVAAHLSLPHRLVDVSEARARPLMFWYSAPHPGNSIFPYTRAQRLAHTLAPIQLNGYSADHVLCPEPSTLMHAMAHTGMLEALKGYGVLYKRYGVRPALGLRAMLARRPPPVPRWASLRLEVPDWIDPDFRREMRLDERFAQLAARSVDYGQGVRPLGIHQLRSNWNWSLQEERWPSNIAPGDAPDPFLDRRVLSFLWSLPPVPWYYRKHLLRSAMRGRLPDAVLNRPKTPAGSQIPTGLAIDSSSELWQSSKDVTAMLRQAGHSAWKSKDSVTGWYPGLLGLWVSNTDAAIQSGHREIDVSAELIISFTQGNASQ